MAIETITREGDLVIRGAGRDLLRFTAGEDQVTVTATELGSRQVIIISTTEAKELRDWLTRRLDEPVPGI